MYTGSSYRKEKVSPMNKILFLLIICSFLIILFLYFDVMHDVTYIKLLEVKIGMTFGSL